MRTRNGIRAVVAMAMALLLLLPGGAALAQTPPTANFSGGAGTVTAAGKLYAKGGQSVTLHVDTTSATNCVSVNGAHEGQMSTSSAISGGKRFSLTWTAGTGDGQQSVTAQLRANSNCGGANQGAVSASYVLDNTGPVVTSAIEPAPNASGWNRSDASITWTATDAGVDYERVCTGAAANRNPNPCTDSVTADTTGTTRGATAFDRLGNSGSGSVTVRLDKSAPTISGARSPAANSHGWNNSDVAVSFTCNDATSGVKSCTGTQTVSAEGGNQSRTGTAVDIADNSAQATVGNISIDRTAPALSGTPTNANLGGDGWYTGDVTIQWTASDGLSGVLAQPGNSSITGEGTGLTATQTVADRAGNSRSASSSAVKIDRTAPVTTIDAPTGWRNTNAIVILSATDNLSDVGVTRYTVNGGAEQTGTSFELAEGVHTIRYWSVDRAGNREAAKAAEVKVDKTAPTITHALNPLANTNGWHKGPVAVTFTCTDNGAGSGIASCTGNNTLTGEGAGQTVTGTATDNAANTAKDVAEVSIDLTAPIVSAARDRDPNGAGWYRNDAFVNFICSDALSGIGVAKGGTDCPDAVAIGEGRNQSAGGSVTDAAGNTASASVTGINVDKTPPSLTGTPSATGWSRGDVTVTWAASDSLSGLASAAPAATTVSGEGGNLSASASSADLAGNITHATVSGIQIDRTAPLTSAEVAAPLPSGWYAGAVAVTLSASDALSQVAETYYSLDGGIAQRYTGPFTVSSKGVNAVTFWSVDHAGNVEDATAASQTITVKIDGIDPTITGRRSPAANANGWNNEPVNVSFDCEDAESGIAADPGCPAPVTLSQAGAGQFVTRSVTDNAGNSASATVANINIDLTAPTSVVAGVTEGAVYATAPTVSCTATDQPGLSGVATHGTPTGNTSTPGVKTVTCNGAVDKAGNEQTVASAAVAYTIAVAPNVVKNVDLLEAQAGTGGWFTGGSVGLTWTITGTPEPTVDQGKDCSPKRISTNGVHSFECAVTNIAGTASGSHAIRYDSTAPTSVVLGVSEGAVYATAPTVSCTATDQPGLSGVATHGTPTGNTS
ncbi:MAG TPA: hypothetical protein VHG70_04570, partial [Nocardioidaceae bacterium]|nr:hypothetical protein [Nocardioidaceae bacterium]